MNNKVVYLHRKKTNNEIFYVGMGSLKRAYHKYGRTNHWENIVNKHGYNIDVVASELTIDEALYLEEFIISEIGLTNLCNLSTGGDHPRLSEETKKKMSKMRKGVSNHTPESIKKQVKSFKNNTEHIKKLSRMTSKRNKDNNPCIKHRIKCVKDGKIFGSVREAGRYYHIDNSYLSKHLRGLYGNVKGLRFEYI